MLFRFAIEHLSRVSRVIKLPGGHTLLVGVGGSGRQSLTRLAAYMAEFEVVSIELAKGYGVPEWREDLKALMMKAGAEGKPTVFDLPVQDSTGQSSTVTAGGLICNDMWADPQCSVTDPMLTHVLAWHMAARVIFHSVNGGPGRVDINIPFHHGNLMRRAQADGLFIVFAQAAYENEQNCATGVVGPNGTILAQVPFGVEGVFVHSINVTQPRKQQRGGSERFGT